MKCNKECNLKKNAEQSLKKDFSKKNFILNFLIIKFQNI